MMRETRRPIPSPKDDQGERRTGRCTRRPLPVRPGGAGPQPRARHVDRVSMTGCQPRCCSVTKRVTTWMLWPPLTAIAVGQREPQNAVNLRAITKARLSAPRCKWRRIHQVVWVRSARRAISRVVGVGTRTASHGSCRTGHLSDRGVGAARAGSVVVGPGPRGRCAVRRLAQAGRRAVRRAPGEMASPAILPRPV
jgi:hypothetical protein